MIWLIQSIDLTQITFNHISSLTNMSREPKSDDFVYFEVEKHKNGAIETVFLVKMVHGFSLIMGKKATKPKSLGFS
jgi:hypothetical protein